MRGGGVSSGNSRGPRELQKAFSQLMFSGPNVHYWLVQSEMGWAPELGLSRCRSAVDPRTQGPANSDEVFWRLENAEDQQRAGRTQRSLRHRDRQERRVPYDFQKRHSSNSEETGWLQERAIAGGRSARAYDQRLEEPGFSAQVRVGDVPTDRQGAARGDVRKTHGRDVPVRFAVDDRITF